MSKPLSVESVCNGSANGMLAPDDVMEDAHWYMPLLNASADTDLQCARTQLLACMLDSPTS